MKNTADLCREIAFRILTPFIPQAFDLGYYMSPFQGLMFMVILHNVKGLKGRNTLAQVEGLRKKWACQ
jgi:hypothetical protein